MRNLDDDKKEVTRLLKVFPKDKTFAMADYAIDRALAAEKKVVRAENAFAEIRNLVYNGIDPMNDIDQIANSMLQEMKTTYDH